MGSEFEVVKESSSRQKTVEDAEGGLCRKAHR